MPRYHFDLQHDADELGCDLPDLAAAQAFARRYAGELLREGPETAIEDRWRMDVRQEGGPVVFSLVMELVPARAEAPKPRSFSPAPVADWA